MTIKKLEGKTTLPQSWKSIDYASNTMTWGGIYILANV